VFLKARAITAVADARSKALRTMPHQIAVTTCPFPRSLSTPKTDIGSTGFYDDDSVQSKSVMVRVLRRRGPVSVVLSGCVSAPLLLAASLRLSLLPRRAEIFRRIRLRP